MTDRELLEAAAKAVGLEYASVLLGSTLSGGIILKDRAGYWNPLTDDGDALRLAMHLGMRVSLRQADADGGAIRKEGTEEDYMAATRRAIVRAAAMAVG